MSSGTSARESAGWLRYLLEQVWHLPYQRVTSAQIAGGALADVDVLLVPNGVSTVASNALGPAGRTRAHRLGQRRRALRRLAWRRRPGRSPRPHNGAPREPKSDIAGTLIRVPVDQSSPLAAGVGPFNWVFYDYDLVMRASDPSHVAARFPAAGSEDFFVSGFARGEEELGGTAAVIDEPVGDRQRHPLLDRPELPRLDRRDAEDALERGARAGRVRRHRRARRFAAARGRGAGGQVRGGVDRRAGVAAAAQRRSTSAEAVRALLGRYGASYTLRTSGSKATFLIANPGGLTGDDHPFAATLPGDLAPPASGVLAFRAP